MTGRHKSKRKPKQKAQPDAKKKKGSKEVALQVVAEAPPPVETAQIQSTPEKAKATAVPARSVTLRNTQCYKCQRWGHRSYGCENDTRCVKCALGHRASECQKSAVLPPCCANCGGDHVASYRGCVAAPKKRRRRRRKPQPAITEKKDVSKLIQAIVKALTIKDFFSDAQLAFLAKELEGEPEKVDASTQVNFEEPQKARTIETSMPEPMDAMVSLAPPTDPEIATPTATVPVGSLITDLSDDDIELVNRLNLQARTFWSLDQDTFNDFLSRQLTHLQPFIVCPVFQDDPDEESLPLP